MKDGLQNSQIQEFLDSLDKFVATLSSAKNNLDGKIELKKVDSGNFLESLQSPSDFIAAGKFRFYFEWEVYDRLQI